MNKLLTKHVLKCGHQTVNELGPFKAKQKGSESRESRLFHGCEETLTGSESPLPRSRDPWAGPALRTEPLQCSIIRVWHGQLLHTAAASTRSTPAELHFNVAPKLGALKNLKDTDTLWLSAVFQTKPSCNLWPWPTVPIVYRCRCPRIKCGILSVFSRWGWWWQTPAGSPRTGASCPTLWTQPNQPNRSLKPPGEDFHCCTQAPVCMQRPRVVEYRLDTVASLFFFFTVKTF